MYISTFDVYYVISRYITAKLTFPRAKSYSVCDQYWSRDNLIVNIRSIIVPQYIKCISIVDYFIGNKIIMYLMILIRIGTSFNPFRNDFNRNRTSLHEQTLLPWISIKIRIFDYHWSNNVLRDNFCERDIGMYSLKKMRLREIMRTERVKRLACIISSRIFQEKRRRCIRARGGKAVLIGQSMLPTSCLMRGQHTVAIDPTVVAAKSISPPSFPFLLGESFIFSYNALFCTV